MSSSEAPGSSTRLPHPDVFHLSAAQGWLELGSAEEARQELLQIRPELRVHPDVVEVRWQLAAREGRWHHCVDLAQSQIRCAPDRPSGYIHLSYALHELKLTEDAYENLLSVVDDFAHETTIHYNLACYSCQMGRHSEARDWLKRAMTLGDGPRIRAMALGDRDLEPLWGQIKRS